MENQTPESSLTFLINRLSSETETGKIVEQAKFLVAFLRTETLVPQVLTS